MKRVYTEAEQKKIQRGRCICDGCGKKAAKKDKLCHKHRKRKWRENNPLLATFGNLRTNSKRRGKAFTISTEYFKNFCEGTNYLELKGRGAASLSIDREDNWKGYEEGNIRAITVHDNSVKRWTDAETIEAPF